MITLKLNQKEARTLTFTIKDSNDLPIDVSGGTCNLYCTVTLEETPVYIFEKVDGDFDKSEGTSGILTVGLTETDLNFNNKAFGVLTIDINANFRIKEIFRFDLTETYE